MNSVERVKRICKERNIPISKLEKDLAFSNGYIAKLKNGTLPDTRLRKISDYLNVSAEYLMTGQEKEPEEKYQIRGEAADIAHQISQNQELLHLFQAARRANPENLQIARDLLVALNKKENDRFF